MNPLTPNTITSLFCPKLLSRQEAEAHFKTLEKGAPAYQAVQRILFQLPPGIHSYQDLQTHQYLKISTIEIGLLGGFPLAPLLKAVADKNGAQKKETADKIWETLLGQKPSEVEEENTKSLADFQVKLSQVNTPQKQDFEAFLKKIGERVASGIQEEDTDYATTLLQALIPYITKEKLKYAALYEAIDKQPVDRSNPTYTSTATNIQNMIQNASNVGSGVQNFGQFTVSGNFSSGNTTMTNYKS